eukprot:86396-Chlamydomonas_euryale.AAC.30
MLLPDCAAGHAHTSGRPRCPLAGPPASWTTYIKGHPLGRRKSPASCPPPPNLALAGPPASRSR